MKAETVSRLNVLSAEATKAEFLKCCGAERWCDGMVAARPFTDSATLVSIADRVFDSLPNEAWLEAFASHPKIGDLDSLRMRLAGNKEWSADEQSGVSTADEEIIRRLADGNRDYAQRFGYVFIVCATGKSAAEMLSLLEERLQNEDDVEFEIACGEQRKITHLRLDKLTLDH